MRRCFGRDAFAEKSSQQILLRRCDDGRGRRVGTCAVGRAALFGYPAREFSRRALALGKPHRFDGARVHEYLGAISYKAGRRPKIVAFWRMQETTGSTREHAADIKAVEWLSLDAAVTRLSQPLERAFLAEVGARAVKSTRLAEGERTPRKLARRIAKKNRSASNGASPDAPAAAALAPPKQNLLRRFFGKRVTAETAPH